MLKFDGEGKLESSGKFELIAPKYVCDNEIEVYHLDSDFLSQIYYDEHEARIQVEIEKITRIT